MMVLHAIGSVHTTCLVPARRPRHAGVVLGGTPVHFARRRAEHDKAMQRVKDAVHEIDAIGVQVKDPDIVLLDFPCVVKGTTIELCWKLGEKQIAD